MVSLLPSSLYQPLSTGQLADPYPIYALMRATQRVSYVQHLFSKGVYVFTHTDDIIHILSHPDTFSSRDALHSLVEWAPQTFVELSKGYPLTPIHINSDGMAHRRFRTPLAKALSTVRVKRLEPFIRAHTDMLVDAFVGEHQADIITQFAYPLPLEVILSLFHLPEQDMHRVKRWCDDWLSLVSSPLDVEQQVVCARHVVDLQHYMAQVIRERREHPKADDLVTELIQHKELDQEILSDAELVHALGGILLAGHETSTNMIGNGLAFLLSQRHHWQTLCEYPDRIPGYIEELLRYDTPAQTFLRTTTCETEIGGVTLPENALLLVVFGAAHRDETKYVHADEFFPERQEKTIVFGYGKHFCVGASLAILEGQIAFETLTRRLPNLRLVPDQTFDHIKTLMFRGFEHLFVEWS